MLTEFISSLPPWGLVEAQMFNGLQQGMLLALISTGLTIIYGTLGVLNISHGALYTLGGYAGYVAYQATGSFTAAIFAGALCTLCIGLVMERGIIRYYYKRPDEDQIIVTFGLGIIIVESIRSFFGGMSQNIPTPTWGQGASQLGFLKYPFPLYKIETIAISALILLIFYLVLYRTRLGLVVRAGIEDSGMVSLLGINVFRAFFVVFAIGAMAAGLAGVINAPITAPTPDGGEKFLVFSFVVVVLGGVGSFPGAIVGGLIAGEIMTLTSLFYPSLSEVMLYVAMALILIFRPRGLFGQAGRA
jgi:branched-chain amino acid transport system permease protein